MSYKFHVFDTPVEVARAIAEQIQSEVKEKNKLSLPFNLAISGGNTPRILFNLFANDFADSIPWHLVRLFWVDERCVPPTHPESNFGMTFKTLLKFVSIPDVNIFRMQGELDPQTEAIRYQQLLETELPLENGFPIFDMVLLGMGDDGHTASIFPSDLTLIQSDLAVSVGVHPQSGQKRITLTIPTLNRAKKVLFFITGFSKSEILKQIIENNSDAIQKKIPASYIHSSKGITEFYLDKTAAQDLQTTK
jgi:6-phosphogluconolactonase